MVPCFQFSKFRFVHKKYFLFQVFKMDLVFAKSQILWLSFYLLVMAIKGPFPFFLEYSNYGYQSP